MFPWDRAPALLGRPQMNHTVDMFESSVPRSEVAASLATSRELGPEYNEEVAAALAERLEATIEERIQAHLAAQLQQTAEPKRQTEGWQVAPVLVSLGVMIPITAIAGGTGGAAGVVAAWIGIVALNVLVLVAMRRS